MVLQRLVLAATILLLSSCSTMGQTLVHRWSFEGNYNDTSGNGHDGTATGTPTFVTGKFGQAAAFDPSPDGGVTPGDGVENTFAEAVPTLATDSWSMNVWANLTTAPPDLVHVMGFGINDDYSGGGDTGRGRALLNFGGMHFWGASVDVNAGTAFSVDSAWHMYTVTYDATATAISLYKDGSLLTTGTAALVDTFPQVQVGNPSFWSEGFAGSLDEFTIFNGTLSEPQVGGLYFFNDHTQNVTLDPSLVVNRDTGEIVLTNDSSFEIDLLGYTVRSASGALDPSAWDTIAGRFDAPPGGNGSIDSNDDWTVLTNTTNEFSIEFSEGVPGTDGGTIAIGKVVSFGAGAWIANPSEDIEIDLLLNDGQGTIKTVSASFAGNGGDNFAAGDFDADGDIDVNDYIHLRTASASNTAGMLPVEAYLGGDLNGDGRKNLTDYAIFAGLFEAANGPGTFAALTSSVAVPEPATLWMLVSAASVLAFRKYRGCILAVLIATFFAGSEATAQLHGYYPLNGNANDASGNNIDLNMVGGALFGGSMHPGLGTAFSGDGVDDAAVGQNFVKVSGNSLSAVAWVYAESNDHTTWETIVKNWGESIAGQFHFGLGVNDANTLNNYYGTAGGAQFLNDVSPTDVPVGQWVHTAFVLDAAAGQHRLYINGNVVATGAYGGTLMQPTDAGFASGLGIGGKPNDDGSAAAGGFGFWRGQIDEVGLYAEALSTSDIAEIIANAQQGIQLDGSTNPYVEIEVNRATGEVKLQNNTAGSVNLNAYEVVSLGDHLNAGGLDPLAGNAGFPTGTGFGDGWELDGANDSSQIIEGFFGGASTFTTGETSLGFIYEGASAGHEDLTFRFATPSGIITSLVTYIGEYASLNGDFNNDGIVNLADYTVWRDNLGAATEEAINNAGNGLNGVDAADYQVWKSAFGSGGSGAVGQASATIPEPTSCVTLLALLALVGRWGRRSGDGEFA
jgi:hypothetical protein